MYKKIVVPVDMGQLDKGDKILAKAQALLDAGGEILLVNVVETVPSYLTIDLPVDFVDVSVKDAEARLADMDARLSAGARKIVRTGSPAREIIDLAETEGADLIIIASHRPGMQDLLLGSTAAKVVRHATCAVHVVR
jgi:nucleotide-binding universal stress UspA family protein